MKFEELPAVNQGNLVKLQRYMVSTYGDTRFDNHFDMEDFQFNGSPPFTEHSCGTSACLLGHGPMAGMPVNSRHLSRGLVDWDDYSYDITGIDVASETWNFLFYGCWTNDIQEAIARLTMYIEGFDPEKEEWHYEDTYTK